MRIFALSGEEWAARRTLLVAPFHDARATISYDNELLTYANIASLAATMRWAVVWFDWNPVLFDCFCATSKATCGHRSMSVATPEF